MKIAIFLVIIASLQSVLCFSTGAPAIACSDLRPNHQPNIPQPGPPPFFVFVSSTNIQPGQTVSILIDSTVEFRGFLVQPRVFGAVPIQSPGTFMSSATSQSIGCHGGVTNTATHLSSAPRSSQTIVWSAPTGFTGRIRFQ